MADEKVLPVFDETDRAIFAIPDTRERADRMRSDLVPKIRRIFDVACERVRDVYQIDPFEDSIITVRPSPRKKAKKTEAVRNAHVGLWAKKKPVSSDIHYTYFSQNISLTPDGLEAEIHVYRPREATRFIEVLRRHEDKVVELLDSALCDLWWTKGSPQKDNHRSIIRTIQIPQNEQWCNMGVAGETLEFPIVDDDAIWVLIYEFVGMFPIYQSVLEYLAGAEERFDVYFEQFKAFAGEDGANEAEDRTRLSDDGAGAPSANTVTSDSNEEIDGLLDENISALEGEILVSLRSHRSRERRLRNAKIQDALVKSGGRLHCEVPGCGFDFEEVYGEIGQGFAHVHHKDPLGERSQPSETKLNDLVIICPNCHAMIHRGGVSRPLEGLIKRPRCIE